MLSQVESGQYFLIWIFGTSLFSLFSLWYAYKISVPLQKIIRRAMKMAYRRRYANLSEEVEIEDLIADDPGEYFQLEKALSKIRRKLKDRRKQISEQKEETLALMSSLRDAVVSIDLNERVNFYNSLFAVQFLNREQKESGYLYLTQVFREPALLNLIREATKDRSSKTKIIGIKNPLTTLTQHFSITASPIIKERDQVLYGLLILFDNISEVRKAVQIRTEFVENASHELRTPLTTIKGYVDALREDIDQNRFDNASKFLRIIDSGVDRLSALVNDMLNLAQLDSGKEIKSEVINLEELSDFTLQNLRKQADAKKIKLQFLLQSKSLQGDRNKIEQVIENLVGNAIKYIQEGGQVDCVWEEDKHHVYLKVKDNGPGIGSEHLPRIFERFYRVDKGRSRDAGGTGLGLAIVKHIVVSHGGQVDVQSSVGKGALFTCSFPKKNDL